MRRKRRVRATFRLQLAICLATAVVLLAVVLIAGAAGTIAAALVLFLFWLFGVELQLLPEVMERYALWRANRTGKPPDPRWFVDDRD